MPRTANDGRMVLEFGPDSRLTRLFAKYAQKFEEAYFGMRPVGMFEAICAAFRRELYPDEKLVSLEEPDKAAGHIPWTYFIENPIAQKQLVAETLEGLVVVASRLAKQTLLESYIGMLGADIAFYLELKLLNTKFLIYERTIDERLGRLEKAITRQQQYVLPPEQVDRAAKVVRAIGKLEAITTGLKSAVLIFGLPNGQAYVHDRRKELFYGIT